MSATDPLRTAPLSLRCRSQSIRGLQVIINRPTRIVAGIIIAIAFALIGLQLLGVLQ